MLWAVVSVASAAVFAIVSILDKIILDRYSPNPATFIVLTGVMQVLGGIVVFAFVPFESYPAPVVFTAFASGLVWGTSLVVMFWVLSREDVSIVMPVIATSPVFVAILAVFFLGEHLTILHWSAIVVTVAGAALVSTRVNRGAIRGPILSASFLLLLLASFFAAGGQFLSKVSLEDMSLWNQLAVRSAGMGVACILLPFRPAVVNEARRLVSSPAGFWLLVLNEGPIAFFAIVLTLWGISLGQVSLAVTLMSTRPLFVFMLSALLSTSLFGILREPVDSRTITRKLVSIAMIVAGISVISLL
jgi:drug/metabolite transporter (DMT)-like permease